MLNARRKSTFEFIFRPDEPPIYDVLLAAQPLRFTEPNNASPSFHGRLRQDNPMLSSRSDFAFPDSSTAVNPDIFVQPNSVSSLSGPRPTPSDFQGSGPLPIKQFLTQSRRDSPWTGLGFQAPRDNQIHSAGFSEPNLNFGDYRNAPQSEIESNATAQYHSDSGYGSHPVVAQSVKSGEYSSQSPDYSYCPDFDTLGLSPMPTQAASPPVQPDDQRLIKSTQRSRGGKRNCEKCSEILKCPSDYRCVLLILLSKCTRLKFGDRKHMLKHDKPNRCDIPGCSRVDGFSTINDLQRHKKSKHGIGIDTITTSFKCASPSCKNQAKIWPRRDNFKQHILRMHKNEDVKALISRHVLSLC